MKTEQAKKKAKQYASAKLWHNKNEKNPTEEQVDFHEHIAEQSYLQGCRDTMKEQKTHK
jgi:myosin-crossreactive antigen